MSFRFDKESLHDRDAKILDNRDDALEMGVEVAQAYRKEHPPQHVVIKMLDCAALVRVNNLNRRPDGFQGFFVWPPHLL
jgi:hypothetical protein